MNRTRTVPLKVGTGGHVLAVHWPAGTAAADRRVPWGAIAWRERGAIVHAVFTS